MGHQQALVPRFLIQRGNKTQENILAAIGGVFLLSALAQVTLSLHWTPVPITGQTFGVALMALLWGRVRAFICILSYLMMGGLGLPIFAMGKSGFLFGPTMGYLIGMVAATYWMGSLSDLGWTKTWWRCYLAAVSGSVITFSFGVMGLSLFVPVEDLWLAGVLPFLPGDFIKSFLASAIVYYSHSYAAGLKDNP